MKTKTFFYLFPAILVLLSGLFVIAYPSLGQTPALKGLHTFVAVILTIACLVFYFLLQGKLENEHDTIEQLSEREIYDNLPDSEEQEFIDTLGEVMDKADQEKLEKMKTKKNKEEDPPFFIGGITW